MLRRRFLARVGPLICAFVVGAIIALWSLQQVLSQLDAANAEGVRLVEGVESVGAAVAEIQLYLRAPDDIAAGAAAAAHLRNVTRALATPPLMQEDHQTAAGIRALAAISDRVCDGLERGNTADLAQVADQARAEVHQVAMMVREHVFTMERSIGNRLRVLVLALSIGALVMVNVAVFVLLRTAQVVLRPVEALVAGSRELAAEHFDHRVIVDRTDEFGELANAYNHLAEQLQGSEERKAEALRQLAVTLNHALNNAMAIIELQLGLLDRQSGGNPVLARHLREIRSSLIRMSDTVASLRNIRRVVLAEYIPGQTMIDLERSVAVDYSPAVVEAKRVGTT